MAAQDGSSVFTSTTITETTGEAEHEQIEEIEVIFGTFGRIGGNALDKCRKSAQTHDGELQPRSDLQPRTGGGFARALVSEQPEHHPNERAVVAASTASFISAAEPHQSNRGARKVL
ncbi:hypothetical protein PR002_g26120 [Phytophthora rubi]|uniref:Uncharacterized protein n=1 Tax=Phytophthora rubi TaxID=129364 RepID=A0A6A3HXC5_9STRA|nr:hypothetical protein PR002_g26120 [Phytophthora rubi]